MIQSKVEAKGEGDEAHTPAMGRPVTAPWWRGRFFRFALVGLSGVGVNFLFVGLGLWAFSSFPIETRDSAASALGIAVSVLTNFLLNDAWTWGDRLKGQGLRAKLWRLGTYVLGAGFAALLQFFVASYARTSLNLHVVPAQGFGIAVGTLINFLFNHYLVFKDKR